MKWGRIMEIVKCNKSSVIRKIRDMQNMLEGYSDRKNSLNVLLKAEQVFENDVKNDGIAIRCSEDEIGPFVFDYLEMLSNKHHLAMCVFVERGVGVYSIKNIRRVTDYSTFSIMLPNDTYDDKIVILVCYYKSYEGEMYDIDLFSKRFCS